MLHYISAKVWKAAVSGPVPWGTFQQVRTLSAELQESKCTVPQHPVKPDSHHLMRITSRATRTKPFTGSHSARESEMEMIGRRKAQPLGGFNTTNAKHFLVHKHFLVRLRGWRWRGLEIV